MSNLYRDLAYILAAGFIAYVIIAIQMMRATIETAQGRIELLERELSAKGIIDRKEE